MMLFAPNNHEQAVRADIMSVVLFLRWMLLIFEMVKVMCGDVAESD